MLELAEALAAPRFHAHRGKVRKRSASSTLKLGALRLLSSARTQFKVQDSLTDGWLGSQVSQSASPQQASQKVLLYQSVLSVSVRVAFRLSSDSRTATFTSSSHERPCRVSERFEVDCTIKNRP